jgi:CheY-like chemotaxis protein
MKPQLFDAQNLEFSHTAFNLLMQRRIYRILLVCSNYDFFMLEEDGRIDERIFNEYTALSIRFPPVIIQADNSKKAFNILQTGEIDLIILMLNIGDSEPFELAKLIRKQYQSVPIVVLTHFSREVSLRLQREDLSCIDHVFCWLGNADLLLAIIKLIEDEMNAEHDVLQIGVQTIMLVEDSIRYISQILPNLYKIIIGQAHGFMQEGLNEHQKMLRLRGRPKILLAKTYDEAKYLFDRYKGHMLGIISDVSFKKNRHLEVESPGGIELCKLARAYDHNLPFLIQSSDGANEKHACELHSGFINKLSKSLVHDLSSYISANFGFGDLVFRDPINNNEIARATDLADLQRLIQKIPDHVLEYYANHDEISKWLNARALFPIGRIFKTLTIRDFDNLGQVRDYIYEAISVYRMSKGHGIIASFDKKSFNEYLTFSRIGEGSLGGKGRGLAFIDSILKKYDLFRIFENVQIVIPKTVVITTSLFDEFMEFNKLYKSALSDLPDDEVLMLFVKSRLPDRLYSDLKSFVDSVSKPIAVRSSSKLEDSQYQPFAGLYSTYMIPQVPGNKKATTNMVADAIKCVYASVYFSASKAYMTATSNVIDEEKMGVILEEVCGSEHENKYCPAVSGVARSINYYPVKPETPDDGIAVIAYGLGKHIVEGGTGLRFSPQYPKKILQLSSPEMALKETQKSFFALDLDPKKWHPSVDDKVNLLKLKITDANSDPAFKLATSTFDPENHQVSETTVEGGKKVITFANILQHDAFPLAGILQKLLEIGQMEMSNPIEIEFAVDLNTLPGEPKTFYFLQIRPIVESDQSVEVSIDEANIEKSLVFSNLALGNGVFRDIHDFVYVKPTTFNSLVTHEIAEEVSKINELMRSSNRNYVLAGPGRWGSTDPNLGVPVKWQQISEARVIIEAGEEDYRIDPSQGTHFFQNLTSFRVGYMTVNPYIHDGIYNVGFLAKQSSTYDGTHIRVVHFEKPLIIKIDGRKNVGLILKTD